MFVGPLIVPIFSLVTNPTCELHRAGLPVGQFSWCELGISDDRQSVAKFAHNL